jgi:adenine-specific DNA-methyltransferase
MSVRLEWDGKPTEVERLSLPFQTVETINQSRATRDRDSGSLLAGEGADACHSPNQLIWGDNKLVMSSLLKDYAGKIDLVYIDPPFATGDDFTIELRIGDESVLKTPSILEEHAYRDTWGHGQDSYLSMMYERLVLMHELLSDKGSIYVQCDTRANSSLRFLLDEIFGEQMFRNEIRWVRSLPKNDPRQFGRSSDCLLYYTKSEERTFHPEYLPQKEESVKAHYREDADGRFYQLASLLAPGGRGPLYEYQGFERNWRFTREKMLAMEAEGRIMVREGQMPRRIYYLDESRGSQIQDVWSDLGPLNSMAKERTGYPTQKPENLLARIINTSSSEGDLIFDCFAGSGTTAVVAESLGRTWIACDLGRFAIHTTRKRLLDIPDCGPFEIKNLGAYERQRWQRESGNGRLTDYLDTILSFYKAEPVEGFTNLHGQKAGRMIHVGATDAPVTIDELEEVMDEMADNGIESCDVLGWEWEMGLNDTISETARRRGLDLRPLQIPREIIEPGVRDADAVRFFELAHVDLDVKRSKREVSVVLKDFAIPSEELIPSQVRDRIESWSDLIDYWSVDFDYTDDTFHNQWQAYRTREEPKLARESDPHEYEGAGRHTIVVKIIDIFGNDTTKLAEVTVK